MADPESTPDTEPASSPEPAEPESTPDEDGGPQRRAGRHDVCVVCEERIAEGSPVGLAPYGPGEERGGPVHLNERCEHERARVSRSRADQGVGR
jgi:hypothetical protein